MQADNNNELPRTRAEAKAVGSKRYFTGKTCKNGHVEPRYTCDGACMGCSRVKSLSLYYDNREARNEKAKVRFRDRYHNDQEYRERCKVYQRNFRASPEGGEKKRSYDRARREGRTPEDIAAEREYQRKYQRERAQSSPRVRLDRAMSGGIYKSIASGAKASRRWETIVDYTVEDLMAHLEKKFKPGMTWDNYGRGGWHIDHIIPRSAFNYETPDDIDFKRCWALDNLQPLWEFDNISKGAKLDKPFQPSLAIAA